MGNICNGSPEFDDSKTSRDQLSKNMTVCQFSLQDFCTIDLVLGSYRCHKGGLLLAIVQQQYLEYSAELRDYSQNFSAVVQEITADRKKIFSVPTSRNCPYKKLLVCVLPAYQSQESDSYLQQFKNQLKEVMIESTDLTLQISHTTQSTNGIPNQTLMAVFFRDIVKCVTKPLRLTIVSSEEKLLNLVRYEIVKLEECSVMPLLTIKDGK